MRRLVHIALFKYYFHTCAHLKQLNTKYKWIIINTSNSITMCIYFYVCKNFCALPPIERAYIAQMVAHIILDSVIFVMMCSLYSHCSVSDDISGEQHRTNSKALYHYYVLTAITLALVEVTKIA